MAILNLPQKIWNLATVNEWATYNTDVYGDTPWFALQRAIEEGTRVGLSYFFTNVWIPVKEVNGNTQTPKQFYDSEFAFANIGLTPTQLSDAYQTLYGYNMLSVPFLTDDYGVKSAGVLGEKIKSIFLMNKGKYLKLLELQGYSYNPLFNVDGVEIRQLLENQGTTDASTTDTPDNYKTTHNVSTYDSGTKEEYNDTLSGSSTSETTYTHNNAKNGGTPDATYGDDYVVQAVDTAFGQMLVGGDKMHVEKYIRQGNIGLTKTQELVAAERENLKYAVIKEFFNDINDQLLVGIYNI